MLSLIDLRLVVVVVGDVFWCVFNLFFAHQDNQLDKSDDEQEIVLLGVTPKVFFLFFLLSPFFLTK